MTTGITPTASHGYVLSDPDFLEVEVRRIMRAGVVTIVEDASLTQVYRAMAAHRVHGVLVVGRHEGKPLGWVTARGLLAWIGRDASLISARDAVTEQPNTISPSASAREAITALSQPGVSHVLVSGGPGLLPEGVVSALDLVVLSGG